MHRFARAALVTASVLLSAYAPAQPRDAAAPASSAPSTPLGSALEALRTTDYARAERELGAIRGADQAAAQVALARLYLETGRYDAADRTALQASSSAAQKLAAVAVR